MLNEMGDEMSTVARDDESERKMLGSKRMRHKYPMTKCQQHPMKIFSVHQIKYTAKVPKR